MFLRSFLAALAGLTLMAGSALSQTTAVSTAPAGRSIDTGHVTLELLSADAVIAPGSTVKLAVRQTIAPGWHTYWKNSGDAGQPTQIVLTLPPGASATEPVWPTPGRMRETSLMTYGYQGKVVTPINVRLPAGLAIGRAATVKARVDLLVCKDICVPEGGDLVVSLPVAAAATPDPLVAQAIDAALAAAPKTAPFKAAAKVEAGSLILGFAGPALKGLDPSGAYFFPYDTKTLDQPSRQAVERGPEGLTIKVKAAPELLAGVAKPVTGVLSVAGQAFEVSAASGPLPAGAAGLGEVPAADEAATPAPATAKPAEGLTAFAVAVALGVLGGIVLNLMPCVFPVLAIKAAALARVGSHHPGKARGDGLAFMLGSVLTFVGLAAGLLALRAAGQAAGWGFQLQSAPVTAGLSLLMLAVALNLSGVFEIGLSLQRAAGSTPTRGGVFGAFATGVLAVMVAAPCTAPFMAAATGYALTASAPLALIVFAAIGVGLALPFTALSFSPGLLSRLPRPGPWMEGLRHVLAFPMYGAAAWLVWVFVQQTGAEALGVLFAAGVALAFAVYLFGVAQRRQAVGGAAVFSLLGAALSLIGAIALACLAATMPPATTSGAVVSDVDRALAAEPFSPERLAALRAEGRPVFVNLTAAWCVTCKVNERVALSRPEVKAAFQSTHTAYLVGDWTRRDAVIAKTLAQYGRAGVPLYLVFKPGKAEPEVLPQLLTGEIVVAAVGR